MYRLQEEERWRKWDGCVLGVSAELQSVVMGIELWAMEI
jgi:hypothetical protein